MAAEMKFEDALKKIEDGTYGECEQCKGLIPKSRLKALPYARLCLKCQQAKEREESVSLRRV